MIELTKKENKNISAGTLNLWLAAASVSYLVIFSIKYIKGDFYVVIIRKDCFDKIIPPKR